MGNNNTYSCDCMPKMVIPGLVAYSPLPGTRGLDDTEGMATAFRQGGINDFKNDACLSAFFNNGVVIPSFSPNFGCTPNNGTGHSHPNNAGAYGIMVPVYPATGLPADATHTPKELGSPEDVAAQTNTAVKTYEERIAKLEAALAEKAKPAEDTAPKATVSNVAYLKERLNSTEFKEYLASEAEDKGTWFTDGTLNKDDVVKAAHEFFNRDPELLKRNYTEAEFKTAVRGLIKDNKDNASNFSWKKTILGGLALGGLGAITFFTGGLALPVAAAITGGSALVGATGSNYLFGDDKELSESDLQA
ncbi:MAG: hypothetical protein U0003_00120 [Vampirovibrionales bacterium]